jgi:hypothetical protein
MWWADALLRRCALTRPADPHPGRARLEIHKRHRWGAFPGGPKWVRIRGRKRRYAVCVYCLCRRYGTRGYLPLYRDSDQGFYARAPRCVWRVS